MSYKGQKVFVRHLSHFQHLDLEDLQERFYQDAIARGLTDEKTRILYLIKEGLWSDKKEREILDQQSYVDGMIAGRKNIYLPSILAKVNEEIKKEQDKLHNLKRVKYELIGLTAENHSQKQVNDHYIKIALYKDAEFQQPLFNESDFDELDDDDVHEIVRLYNNATEVCSDGNIKKLAIQDFYQAYYFLCQDDFVSFFGKSICNFTFFQVKLANYSRYFKSILEGVDINTLPEKARTDPDELVSYLDTRKKGQEVIEKASAGGAASIVGATKEDLKTIAGTDAEIVKLPNKPMNMVEFMKAMQKE